MSKYDLDAAFGAVEAKDESKPPREHSPPRDRRRYVAMQSVRQSVGRRQVIRFSPICQVAIATSPAPLEVPLQVAFFSPQALDVLTPQPVPPPVTNTSLQVIEPQALVVLVLTPLKKPIAAPTLIITRVH